MIKKHRINGVGELEIRMELKNNIIKNINIMGDYFLIGDIDNCILQPLQNTPYNKEAISKALPDRIDDIILHLQKQDFINLL